ncbi:MAG: SemiSWEET family sugar transporter [Bacteroidales bacterium]|nr:SemiSWEET family sugar transporter [Bacteroidales bacterium]
MNLITILGLVAAACTTISFLPQAIKAVRTRQTKDISLGMYTLLTTGIVLWLIYGVIKNDLPIILANGITLVFAATILFLKIKYK